VEFGFLQCVRASYKIELETYQSGAAIRLAFCDNLLCGNQWCELRNVRKSGVVQLIALRNFGPIAGQTSVSRASIPKSDNNTHPLQSVSAILVCVWLASLNLDFVKNYNLVKILHSWTLLYSLVRSQCLLALISKYFVSYITLTKSHTLECLARELFDCHLLFVSEFYSFSMWLKCSYTC